MSSFKDNSDSTAFELQQAVTTKLRVVAHEYRRDLRKKLDRPPARSGSFYSKGGRTHQASAPGEPPAPLSRDLIESIQITHTSRFFLADKFTVFSPLNYAFFLEEGTSNMEVRPAWKETLRENEQKYANLIKESGWF